MKKLIALISAAIITVAVAGCVHKNPVTDSTDPSATNEQGEEITTVSEESGSVSSTVRTTRAYVTDADGNRVTQTGNKHYSKITLYSTRAPAPDVLTQRPTTTARVTIPPAKPPATKNPPRTTGTSSPAKPTATPTRPTDVLKPTEKTTARPSTTAKPTTTSVPFKAPEVVYSGTYGTDKDKVRIKSHEVVLAQSKSILITLQFDTVAESGTVQLINISYDCYDAAGNKINPKPVTVPVPLKTGEFMATAPLNTAKIVFINN